MVEDRDDESAGDVGVFMLSGQERLEAEKERLGRFQGDQLRWWCSFLKWLSTWRDSSDMRLI
jgi:hypothetical protein